MRVALALGREDCDTARALARYLKQTGVDASLHDFAGCSGRDIPPQESHAVVFSALPAPADPNRPLLASLLSEQTALAGGAAVLVTPEARAIVWSGAAVRVSGDSGVSIAPARVLYRPAELAGLLQLSHAGPTGPLFPSESQRQIRRRLVHNLSRDLTGTMLRDGEISPQASLLRVFEEMYGNTGSQQAARRLELWALGQGETDAGAERDLLERIDRQDEPEPAPHESSPGPPDGYENVLIADDDGYPDDSLAMLEDLGYHVQVCRDEASASMMLASDPHPVFVCDLQFDGDPNAGLRLMSQARTVKECLLTIALTGARIDPADAPPAQAICAGPTAKRPAGARELHRIICEWAARS